MIGSILFMVLILSCSDEVKKSEESSEKEKAKESVTKSFAPVTFPKFKVKASDLPPVTGGGAHLMPSKFIINYELGNFNDPANTMTLLLYPANGHPHYGVNTTPITGGPSGDTETLDITNVVLGHNELITQALVGGSPQHNYLFDYLILTPTIYQASDNKPHLVFKVEPYSADGLKITTITIPDSNPCPPNQPGN